LNDYPTAARADYVFGCMAVNGGTRRALEQCSCSIDVIASILTYRQYVEAETVLSLRQEGGERMSVFRDSAMARTIVLHHASQLSRRLRNTEKEDQSSGVVIGAHPVLLPWLGVEGVFPDSAGRRHPSQVREVRLWKLCCSQSSGTAMQELVRGQAILTKSRNGVGTRAASETSSAKRDS
jgi:hypothetical protein